MEELVRLALRAGDHGGVISATAALAQRREILRQRMRRAREAGAVAATAEDVFERERIASLAARREAVL